MKLFSGSTGEIIVFVALLPTGYVPKLAAGVVGKYRGSFLTENE